MLKVKRLHPDAKLPTVAHTGEDLAYDLYALEDVFLHICKPISVRTGIAAQAYEPNDPIFRGPEKLGLLIKDRSSMAARGIVTSGGVIDHGYTGEISVIMNYLAIKFSKDFDGNGYQIRKGDKIAQMIPIPILTGTVIEVDDLSVSSRGSKGFGSSGR